MKFKQVVFIVSFLLLVITSCSNNKKNTHDENWCDQPLRPELSALEETSTTSNWFKVYNVGTNVYAIAEPYNFQEIISYLILGEKKALLFDTGMGLSSIATLVREITDLPVTVINSHTHYDHIGGNYEFDTILTMNTPYSINRATNGLSHEIVKQEVTKEAICLDKLPKLDTLNYQINSFPISNFIKDRDIIQLGNRAIEVIEVSGHTPDAIALLDKKNGYLWTGDTFYEAPIWLFDEETNLDNYKASIYRLSKLVPNLKKVFPAHNKPIAKPERLTELVDAFDQILEGTKENEKPEEAVAHFEFEHFSFRIRKELLE